jgi:phage shock protein PspC (stress-responsive transcriptional regulator)
MPLAGNSRQAGDVITTPIQEAIPVMDSIRDSFRQQGLVRPTRGRVLGGVCAGLGRRFNISPNVARLLFVVVLLVLPGSQFLIYPLLWFLMPDEKAIYPVPPAGTPYPPAG